MANEYISSRSQISVTARDDVPPFGPVLPDPPVFTDVRAHTTLALSFFLIPILMLIKESPKPKTRRRQIVE